MLRLAWDVRRVSETLGANWTDVKGQSEQHRMHNLITIKTGQQSRLRGGCQRFKWKRGCHAAVEGTAELVLQL